MTATCFFRYAWIAPEAFEALLPATPCLECLSAHLRAGIMLAEAVPPAALRSNAIGRLLAFARRPRLFETPSPRLLRSAGRWAATQGEREAAALVDWCAGLLARLQTCETQEDGDLVLLERLALSDFPVLLLWSNPALARRLFVATGQKVGVAPVIAASNKACRKVTNACLGYALAAFGRFGPRDAWVGAGFAVVEGPSAPMLIQRSDEVLRIEPNIGWMARHWFAGEPGEVLAGEDGWAHVRRRLVSRPERPPALAEALENLQARADAVGPRSWCYLEVEAFLKETDAILARTVNAATWRAEPHRWWVTRLLEGELRLRANLTGDAEALYRATRARWLEADLAASSPFGRDKIVPFPLRAVQAVPATLLASADEPSNWVLEVGALRRGPRAFLPPKAPAPVAIVLRLEKTRACYELCEPNPRRTAEVVGRHLHGSIRYLEGDEQATAIAPPPDVLDQRLLRRAQAERPLEAIRPTADAVLRIPLTTAALQPLIARELASPRYAHAPDLLPTLYDEGAAQALSFGRLDASNRLWLLAAGEATLLAARLKSSTALATFYRLEIHAALGAPDWISILAEGKTSRMPTRSASAFRMLLHACRTAVSPIVVRAPHFDFIEPVLCDAAGRPLAMEIYVASDGVA